MEDEKLILLDIRAKLDELMFLLPSRIPLSSLSDQLGKKYNTIYAYVTRNFEPEADFYKIGGKIYVVKDVALCIRRKYAK